MGPYLEIEFLQMQSCAILQEGGVLVRRGDETETDAEGGRPCEAGGGGCMDATTVRCHLGPLEAGRGQEGSGLRDVRGTLSGNTWTVDF